MEIMLPIADVLELIHSESKPMMEQASTSQSSSSVVKGIREDLSNLNDFLSQELKSMFGFIPSKQQVTD